VKANRGGQKIKDPLPCGASALACAPARRRGQVGMDLRQFYRLDQTFGGWLCRAAGMVTSRPARVLPPSEWRKVAVAKYVGIGSLVLSVPLLQLLRRYCPQAELAMVTAQSLADWARMLPVDRVFAWDIGSLSSALRSFPRFLHSLRSWRPDAFLDLEFFSNTSALIAWLSRAPIRVGFHHAQSPRGRLLTHYLPVTPRHTSELFAGLLWSFGVAVEPLPSLLPLRYEPQRVRSELRSSPPFRWQRWMPPPPVMPSPPP